MQKFTVSFYPDNVTVEVPWGTPIFQAAAQAGIELKSTCGNKGTCGRCLVRVRGGKVRLLEGNIPLRWRKAGYILSCRALAESNLVVEVPKDARLDEHQVLVEGLWEETKQGEEVAFGLLAGYEFSPLYHQLYLELEPPTLAGNASDWSRLRTEICKQASCEERSITINFQTLKALSEILREGKWQVTATLVHLNRESEVESVAPGFLLRKNFGLAIDLGTTTVVAYLVDLETGAIIDRRGTHNKQAPYGDDVISRIARATESGGLAKLQAAVIDTVNELIAKIINKHGIKAGEIRVAVAAGNTTMSHLFLGLPPGYIRLEPYIPVATEFPPVKAKELGLTINPEGYVFTMPCVASYLGGDIVAGVLVTRVAQTEELTLFIDIGTNGELVLGNKDWLLACACSAGPAFEGGGITFGQRAMKGAIERVEIDPQTFEVKVKTIGDYKPLGICGSGLIDCLGKLRRTGLIDRSGSFREDRQTPRLRRGEEPEFVLVWGEETECGRDIVITESDLKNLVRSKGAVFAGIQSLLRALSLKPAELQSVLIAGGFGNYLNIKDAIEIGLLPDLPEERFKFVGNTSVKGAELALLSREAYAEALKIARKITYLELSAGNKFMEEFVSALFLPHTNLALFPSVAD